MIGGLKKTASRAAMLAAAGVLLGGLHLAPANAADLGGDCCADLEERIAELEVTTARKGTRKTTLTVYGFVNRALLYWDDGIQSDVYSVDNDNASTRFGFKGKVSPIAGLEIGYLIEVDWNSAASNEVSNISNWRAFNAPADADPVLANGNADDGVIFGADMRHAAVYLKTARGKVTLGHTSQPMSGITEIDLSGTKVVATARGIRWNQNFVLAVNGAYYSNGTHALTWGNISPLRGHLGGTRRDLIRYDSPTIAGFTLSAAWGEDDFWGVAGRWAGSLGDFNIAAGLGYREHNGRQTVVDALGAAYTAGDSEDNGNTGTGVDILAGSAAVLHVPTGLNLHFAAGQAVHANVTPGRDDTTTFWYIKGGLKAKHFAMGPTALYAEYYDSENGAAGATANAAFNGGFLIDNSDVDFWGLGVVQHIPSAATEIYLGYRKFTGSATITPIGGAPVNVGFDDLDMVMGGMRVKF